MGTLGFVGTLAEGAMQVQGIDGYGVEGRQSIFFKSFFRAATGSSDGINCHIHHQSITFDKEASNLCWPYSVQEEMT